jgi:hypothetical protein
VKNRKIVGYNSGRYTGEKTNNAYTSWDAVYWEENILGVPTYIER